METRAGDKYLSELWTESKNILKLMLSTIPTQILVSLPCSLCYMFAGHVSIEDLDAVGIGLIYIYSTAFSTSIGLAISCEVLFSQANGSVKRSSLGLIIQRCMMISFIVFLINGALAANSYMLVQFLGKSDIFVEKYHYFIVATIPGYWGFSVMLIEMKYLQCQKIVKPCVIIGITANILHIIYGLSLTWWTELVSTGTGLSFSITYWLWAILLFIYIIFSEVYVDTWVPWSTECFNYWCPILKIAIPNMALVWIEFILFQCFSLLCAALGSYYLSIYLIACNISETAFNLYIGSCSAVIIEIGNYLGNGDHEKAKLSATASVFLAACQSVLNSCFIMAFCYVLPFLYSNDNLLIKESRPLVIIVGVTHLLNGVGFINGGLIKACSKQQFVMVTHIVSYGVVGVSIAYCLMFWAEFNVYGAMIGILVASGLMSIANCIRAHYLNWKQEAVLAVEQAHQTTNIEKNIYHYGDWTQIEGQESTKLLSKSSTINWKTVLWKNFYIAVFSCLFLGSIFISLFWSLDV